MRSSLRTWRIRGIPRGIDPQQLSRALRYHSDLRWPGDGLKDSQNSGNEVIIHTLAPDLRVDQQVATVRFDDLPSQLQALGARDELPIKITINRESPRVEETHDSVSEVLIDEHFDGITTLYSPATDEEHQIDVLAVPGLGSHPFGSFVNKKDGNVWLTNNLPRDIPTSRVMIFGHDTKLQNSRSHLQLDDLAGPVHIAISQISTSFKKRPLLLIGHNIGGLLLKEALIRIAESGLNVGLPNALNMIMGVLLFGTPNDGLDIDSLVPMVQDQPNRSLIESLSSRHSPVLRHQRKEFWKVLEHTKLQLFCFYETELSPTAVQDPETRQWKMAGPHRLLVSEPSATSCLPAGAPSTHSVPIRRNHSDLIKFSSHDAEYDKVVYIIKQIQEISTSHKNEREFQLPQVKQEPQEGPSASGQRSILEGGMQIHNPLKRPADERLSPEVWKRPRLASQASERGQSQVDEDSALLDTVSYDESRSVKQDLIGRLYFSKIDERLTHLASAQGTTCRWFLADAKYQSWQDVAQQPEHGGFLWIKGNPGTGKSTLMKYLFQATKMESQKDPSQITLSFFFLAGGTAEEKTTTGLYRSLLHQLLEIAPDLRDSLAWMTFDGARNIQQKGWSEEALKQTLKHAVPKLGNRCLTMFVDALDECDADKADDMVSFFEELCDYAGEVGVLLRICFSSRYYPTVVINKGHEVSLEAENGHAEDIEKYVRSKLRLKSKSKHTEELCSEILEKSSGIFLWVVIVLDILNKETSTSIKKLREHLQTIPPGLDDLFRMILARDGENLEQLQSCLNWILFASRPLKPQELYFAIHFGSDDKCSGFWDQTDLDLDDIKTFVRTSSKGLAEVTPNKASEVRFIHESVRDFLIGQYGHQWSGTSENVQGHGHRVLTECCLAQLNAPINKRIEIPNPLPRASQAAQLRKTISLEFPFLTYSVQNVLHHSNLAQRDGIEQGYSLSDFPMQRWVTLNNILEQYEIRRYTYSVSLLYLLGERNLADLIRINPRRKFCFQIEAERYGAPMLAALANNSLEAVRAFFRAQAEDEPPTSLLHGLSEQHRNSPSRFSRDYKFTPRTATTFLHDLIDKDEETVALALVSSPHRHGELLSLSKSLDVKLLSLAIERGHETIFRTLLQTCEPVGQKSECLDALLRQAANHGSEAIVRLLLDTGPNVEKSGKGGETPLSNAASNGHLAVVRLLIDAGADVERRGKEGETPLSNAASNGHLAVVRLLLEKGANIDSRNNDGKTPLWDAVRKGHNAVVELLLNKGADINSKSTNGETVLVATAHQQNSAALKFLLKMSADNESKDNDGRTLLSWESSNGNIPPSDLERIIVMLEKAGADIKSEYTDGRITLSWESSNEEAGREEAGRDDTEEEANISHQDDDVSYRDDTAWRHDHQTSQQEAEAQAEAQRGEEDIFLAEDETSRRDSDLRSQNVSPPNTTQLAGIRGENRDSGSQVSNTLTLAQGNQLVLSGFSGTLLEQADPEGGHLAPDEYISKHLMEDLGTALESFSAVAVHHISNELYTVGIGIFQRFRSQITLQVHSGILGGSDRNARPRQNGLPQLESSDSSTASDIATETENGSVDLNESEASTSQLHRIRTDYYIEVLSALTGGEDFRNLVRETKLMMARYNSVKRDLISKRISMALHEFGAAEKSHFEVDFYVEWDLLGFLKDNYEDGAKQDIKKIAAVTGTSDCPMLCSVGEYLEMQWPNLSRLLLDAISDDLIGKSSLQEMSHGSEDGYVVFEPTSLRHTKRKCKVTGSEDFIVCIAQQISWLAAAFYKDPPELLSHAFVGFIESPAMASSAGPAFELDVQLRPTSTESCWKSLVGQAVIIHGFPVPARDHGMKGIEISLPVMVAMADLPLVLSIDGKPILKGLNRALFPVESVGSSIQWHMLDVYPQHLDSSRILKDHPSILQGSIDEFIDRRSFVGWCSEVEEVLGTDCFPFESVTKSTGTREAPWRFGLDPKLQFGFSRYLTFNLGITLARSQGYQSPKPQLYTQVLEAAKSIPVLLVDTKEKRATLSNGEDMILQILLHRQPKMDKAPSQTQHIEGANPKRTGGSTRDAMNKNMDKIIDVQSNVKESGTVDIYFKAEAYRLLEWLSGLRDAGLRDPESFESNVVPGRLIGFEYMALVEDIALHPAHRKSIDLCHSNGGWYAYIRDLRALVLFADSLPDILGPPKDSPPVCEACRVLPRGKYSLTVRASDINTQVQAHRTKTHPSRLTEDGWTLQGSHNPFLPCDGNNNCGNKIVTLERNPGLGAAHFVHEFPESGAMVINVPSGFFGYRTMHR